MSANTTITIDYNAFDDALQTIKKAKVRSENTNPEFPTNILNETDASSVVAYQTAIVEMQGCLQRYNAALQADIDKFQTIASALEAADRASGACM
ncbi:MAG: hypothetical protein LBP24_04235 [Coriobacteriales bacterium]|jgi:type VII secretion effector (TIGR04197 family)|nr:hypothetical protein [Coriobacteriales bacterium]